MFILYSPNNKLQVELKITGEFPRVFLYRLGKFCIQSKFVYENSYDEDKIKLIRKVSPELENYKNEVIKNFRTNPYNPCFPPLHVKQIQGSAEVDIRIGFSNWDDFNDSNNFITFYCAGYTNPYVIEVFGDKIVYASGEDLSQFLLSCGSKYKVSFQLSGTSITWKTYALNANMNLPNDYGPSFVGCESNLNFVLYDVLNKSPIVYSNESEIPSGSDPVETIVKLDPKENNQPNKDDNYISVDYHTNGYYIFTVPGKQGEMRPYATRINNFKYVFYTTSQNTLFYGFWDLNVKLFLSII